MGLVCKTLRAFLDGRAISDNASKYALGHHELSFPIPEKEWADLQRDLKLDAKGDFIEENGNILERAALYVGMYFRPIKIAQVIYHDFK